MVCCDKLIGDGPRRRRALRLGFGQVVLVDHEECGLRILRPIKSWLPWIEFVHRTGFPTKPSLAIK